VKILLLWNKRRR